MNKNLLMLTAAVFLLAACQKQEAPRTDPPLAVEMQGGELVRSGDILDFSYTYDNINYNAFYQRYRFYSQEGKHRFFHETRQVVDNYGPATEEDTTLTGTLDLTEKEWEAFLELIGGGSMRPRQEEVLDGDDGPWIYIYLENGDPEGLEYSFASYERQGEFTEFCRELAGAK